MKNVLFRLFLFALLFSTIEAAAQRRLPRPTQTPRDRTSTQPSASAELDSLRKIEDEARDTLIITAKYIRYTNVGLLQDSTQTLPLDTTFHNYHNYNPLNQPERPTVNLGNLGLPYREMLYRPAGIIGFDPGFHSLDLYLLKQDSINYYRARSPFTSLTYVNGALKEQFFKLTHSQNIKPNWNVGANYFRIGSEGFYRNQTANHLNAAVFTWYESKNRRYNVLANGLFNTIKAGENGGVINTNLFEKDKEQITAAEEVRLGNRDGEFNDESPRQEWRQKEYFIKQFYYIGRLDSLASGANSNILPTQRVSHALTYSNHLFKFYKNEGQDTLQRVFPRLPLDTLTIDSTRVKNLRNEFMYSFYLRGRSVSFIKNELKLDVGLQHDLYWYDQMDYKTTFQNITLKANVGYQFSNRVSILGNLQQIAQGRNAGDYLYDAKTQFLLSSSVGKIILGAYLENKSPAQMFERTNYTYHQWNTNFESTKTNNLSFTYVNPKFRFQAKADYFLIANHLYFAADAADSLQIVPTTFGKNVNLLKITINKAFRFGKFNLENFIVYQKTDFESVLRTPEIYTYNSFYFASRFFKSIGVNLGVDARWNSAFEAPSYAVNVSQFYNGEPERFSSFPIVDVWAKFALKRANIFLRYDYLNQGLLSDGYYTVNRYPMPDRLLKFGVTWNFYD